VVNASLISGLNSPSELALDGDGHLFVANYYCGNWPGNDTLGEYTTSGAVVNASLISGLDRPVGVALDGDGHLFVSSCGSGIIGEYTTAGAEVNASLVTGLHNPLGLVVVPEPSSAVLVMAGLLCLVRRIPARNRFGVAFKQITGLSPKQFRDTRLR
jgi:glucose/arabinose dehydrogenase